jgi:hypothetical protein
LFTGIGDKKVKQRNDYVPEGDHVLKVLNLKTDKAFGGYGYILSELEVVETDNPKLKVGQTVSLFIKMQNGTPWMENLKAFLGAAMGYENADDVDEADCETAMAADNPLAGTLVRCTGKKRPTKKDPSKEFTNLTWKAFEGAASAE